MSGASSDDGSIDRDATVFVTRPAGDAGQLIDALRGRGRSVVALPVLGIERVDDPSTLVDTMRRIDDYRLVVFVSPNAIRQALAHRVEPWPRDVAIGVMGPGSVDALRRSGITVPHYRVLSPRGASAARGGDGEDAAAGPAPSSRRPGPLLATDGIATVSGPGFRPDGDDRTGDAAGSVARFDSEALFGVLDAELELSTNPGRVLILRGNGGRAWLADRLRGLGISVDEVEAYRRVRPALEPTTADALRMLVGANAPSLFIVTSSEGLDNLIALVDAAGDGARDWLFGATLLAPHGRIVDKARTAGFTRVVLCAPGDAGILAAIE